MKKRKQQPQKLTNRFGSLYLGKHITIALLISVTLSTGIFIFTMGPIAEPDFWHPVQVVDHIAELIMFSAVSLVFVAQLGYCWHLFLAAVDAAVQLMEQFGQSYVGWQTAAFTELHLAYVRSLPVRSRSAAEIRSLVHALQTTIHRQLCRQRPKSKAPILLFQQAPLLVAP